MSLSKKKRYGNRQIGNGFEVCERRDLCAGDVTLHDRILDFHGGPGNDSGRVSTQGAFIVFNFNGQRGRVRASNVGLLQFDGGAGNDSFVVDNVPRALRASGGNGNDSIRILGRSRPSSIRGGDGNDFLGFGNIPGERPNRGFGGNGNDYLKGGSGHDVLMGELGADTLTGNGNTDWLSAGKDDGSVDYIFARDGESLDRIMDTEPQDVVRADAGTYPGGNRYSDFSGQQVINGNEVDLDETFYAGIEGIFFRSRTVSDNGEVFTEELRANGIVNVISRNRAEIEPQLEQKIEDEFELHRGFFG